jgi:peptidoglycan hydrolase CwlO-like protein
MLRSVRSRLPFLATITLATTILTGTPAGVAQSVDDAAAALEQSTVRLIAAEARARRIELDIAAIEQQIADAEAAADAARAEATERAVEMYMSADPDLVSVLAGPTAVETARRVELVDRANADANSAFDRLEAVTDDLEARQAELEATRSEQEALTAELAAERAALESELARVQAEYDAEQTRLAAAAATEAAAPSTLSAPSSTARSTTTGADPPTAPDTTPDTESEAPPAPEPRPAPEPPAGEHPRHDDPFLVCTRARESGGNYAAVSPTGYHGAYQFHPTTWDGTAAHAGRGELIGVLPSRASEYDQDDMAWHLYQWQGKTPWLGRC